MVTAPTLYRGKIYCLAGCGSDKMHIYAIHMENGTVDWNVTMSGRCGLEANSLLAVRSTLVMPFADPSDPVLRAGGANGLRAVSTGNGTHLWIFRLMTSFGISPPPPSMTALWFFQLVVVPFIASPWATGQVIWKVSSPHPDPWPFMCGTGGGAMGPNGIFYGREQCEQSAKAGRVAAYDASNGQKLWQRNMDEGYEGIQYPAVGRLGPNGKLAVAWGWAKIQASAFAEGRSHTEIFDWSRVSERNAGGVNWVNRRSGGPSDRSNSGWLAGWAALL